LQIAPSTYYAARDREPSARQQRDEELKPVLYDLWVKNRKVYGAIKLSKAATNANIDIGRDQTARLMREMGIRGVARKRSKITTTVSDDRKRPADLVDRNFVASKPDELWVTDLTYVPTRERMAYACFILDVYARYIVGWTVAANMKTEMVLNALEMASNTRGVNLQGLKCHSDAGSQFTSLRWTERLDEIGAKPSIGSIADSYDNAMAESLNALYKTELIYHPDQNGWDTIADVELATLSYVHWWNQQRLHGAINHLTPNRKETMYNQTKPKTLAQTMT